MNRSYVFSQETLDEAIELWVKERTQKASEKEEAFLIVQAALPWFMHHLKQTREVCVFTEDILLREIDYWKADQMVNWPQQQTRIEETCDLLLEFFHSYIVKQLKMVVASL